uniref:Ribonuclease P protein component 4 n=1 Tax=Staphylothermus marinus TaxID=2280 RepID=A0A7C4NVD3_STAMA
MLKLRSSVIRDLANQRITYLYNLAVIETRKGRFDLARRYINIIIRISSKAQVRPYKYIRRGYCRKCKIPLIPGLTSRVRIRSEKKSSRVVVTCLLCGWRRRYMIKLKH